MPAERGSCIPSPRLRRRSRVGTVVHDSSGRAVAIRLDDVPVSATWIDETGASQSASVNIPVPDCAKQLLEACDDGRV